MAGADGFVAVSREPGERTIGAGAPAPALRLALLGGFRLSTGSTELRLPSNGRRLLAFLALRGRTSRSVLAGTLWPEVEEGRALASLRTGIWRIQQASHSLVLASAATLDLDEGVLVDVRELTAGAQVLLQGGVGEPSQWWLDVRLQEELLPEWQDEWLIVDRERLRQLRLHALERLAECWMLLGRHGLALQAALAAVAADPLRESAHRIVIVVHLAEGNVGEALRQFHSCRRVLERELDIEPSPELMRLVPGLGDSLHRSRT